MSPSEAQRIIFLDASTFDRGDVSFEKFTSQWACEFHAVTDPADRAPRMDGCTAVVTNKVMLDGDIMDAPEAKSLRHIAIAATGVNVVDLDAAKARDIAVTNVPGYSSDSVAQHAFGLILELASHAGAYTADVRDGAWSRSPIFTMLTRARPELAGRTLGVVGFGAIGRAVADVGRAFKMEVIYSDQPHVTDPGRVEPDELFARADVISLHCPLTPETDQIINARTLGMMKDTAIIINTARGGLVDESALIEALEQGKIAGAGLDVISVEPPPEDHPVVAAARRMDNLLVTPHVSWSTQEARQRLLDEVAENIATHLRGGERNRV